MASMISAASSSFNLLTSRSAPQLPAANKSWSVNFGSHFALHGEQQFAAAARRYTPPKACITQRNVVAKAAPVPSTDITGVVDAPYPPVRGANLGAWLVTEGWMTPWLFDGIINKDLLDGTKVYFKSVLYDKYLTAEKGGGAAIVATESTPGAVPPFGENNETFTFWRTSPTNFQFKTTGGEFVGLDNWHVVAFTPSPGKDNTFEIIRNFDDKYRVRIRAPNGRFLQAKADGTVTADYSEESTIWADDDPSVFSMTVNSVMDGEFQVTNGYGRERAEIVMRNHWNTYIVEADFKFMAENGLNAVRLPVGYWIMYGDNPPWPFVGGSVKVLDDAFKWGEKHGIRIIIDLHAVPGAATSAGHSASRDGSVGWGSDETIKETIQVIDFLAQRYAAKPNLLGIQLINEPLGFHISVETLSKYYVQGHAAVRKHSPSCYVILAQRLFSEDYGEFLPVASGLDRTVIDDHYYHIIYPQFTGLSAQQNIDYVYNERAEQMKIINEANGRPLLFIGEWTTEWQAKDAPPEEYKRFAEAQIDQYNHATFGWSHWSLKCVKNFWSMKWMIENGYISLPVPIEVKA